MDLRTKALMVSSALVMLVLGIAGTFAPQELLQRSGSVATPLAVLMVQAAGGLYLGFAALNWMAKDSLIGGIYSRPVAMGNFLHFLVVAIALGKLVARGHRELPMLVLGVVYLVFAVWFWRVAFTHPAGRPEVARG